MVQYTKLVVYRDSLCLYYSSGTNNSIRINLDIRINDFNQRDKNRIKTLIKKGLIPEELELFKDEIYRTKNRANSKVSQFKTKYGRKPSTEEFKNLIKEKDFEVEEGFMVLYEEFIEFKKIDFK